MSEQELEQVILDKLRAIYNAEYIGKLKVRKLDPIGYEIRLGMNTPECPDIIYAELEDQDFLNFLDEELKHRRINTILYSTLLKTMPPECNSINTSCSCNDKRRIN